ncbi:gypsy type transposase [Tanacetum coccineum]
MFRTSIILNKVPEKLEDPRKFLIPCALQELDRTNALADSRASINLLPHSIYKQLGLGALKPTRMTLKLANVSWDAGHIRRLPGKNVQVTLEQTTQLVAAFLSGSFPSGPETITHSNGTNLLLFRVITPPSTGSFSIPDDDLTTTKFLQAEVECSSSPIFTSSCICSIGHIISPLNPIKGVVAGTNWFLISGRSRLKKCSYSISEADSPSTYMWCIQWPPTSASMIIGPSIPSSSSRGGKEIFGL